MPELNLTSQNFDQEVLSSKEVILLDFWAPWCGPCQMQGPVILELSKEYEGKPVKIAKINIDENKELADKYKVLSIPTLLILKEGKEVERMQGFQGKDLLVEKIESYL